MNSIAKTSITLTELAGAAGLTESALRYRVRHHQVTPADRDGLFDRQRALAELARKPKQRGGRKSGATKRPPNTSAAFRDATDRYRRARAQIEELKLAHMRGEVLGAKTVERRLFAFFRMV